MGETRRELPFGLSSSDRAFEIVDVAIA